MTYQRFTPRHSEHATPATTATAATLAASDRNSGSSVADVASVAAGPSLNHRSVANVATVAGASLSSLHTVADVAVVAGHDEFEERAALIEYGASVPRAWAEGFARLNCVNPIDGFSPEAWRHLIDDSGVFLDRWSGEAVGLGWTVADVFGVDPTAPAARFDRMGLVPLIRGGAVVAIDANSATIQTRTGGTLRYRRANVAGEAAPLWEIDR